jgi:hypothetical protein
MEHPRKPDLARLTAPIPWRPALQISDASYPLTKQGLSDLIRRAQKPRLA